MLSWKTTGCPPELNSMLAVLSVAYPLRPDAEGDELRFVPAKDGKCRVDRQGEVIEIAYDRTAAAAFGTGMALAGLSGEFDCSLRPGVMIDCSRGAVMRVETVKSWLRKLALAGYERIMLYTEDVYQLDGEPYFGYMRGAYSGAEIREIDDFAYSLGIEMNACIQTMAHLRQGLHWDTYRYTRDLPDILLVGAEKTYELIGKMLDFWRANLCSKCIHIGLDEAAYLGRGAYMNRHGYRPQLELFMEHTARVCDMCRERNLSPSAWSDMFFFLNTPRRIYYEPEVVFPEAMKKSIPPELKLVYWDYYQTDPDFYEKFILRHRELGGTPVVASGIWTWSGFWYNHRQTESTVRACVEGCRRTGVEEMFFTLWGDDGCYCEFDSAWAGLIWGAALIHVREGDTADLFRAICGHEVEPYITGSKLVEPIVHSANFEAVHHAVIWDDPLFGKYYRELNAAAPALIDQLIANAEEVMRISGEDTGDDLNFLWFAAKVAVEKLHYRRRLERAYAEDDRPELRVLRDEAKKMAALYTHFEELFRKQWLRRNKPFGLDLIQSRFATLERRYIELARRLDDYLNGLCGRIEELDETLKSDQPLSGLYCSAKTWLYSGDVI